MSVASQPQLAAIDDPLVGSQIEGRYAIEAVHGRGGMGVVYAGLHRDQGHAVAIKVLDGTWARDPQAVDLFLREAQTASELSHANIVAVSDLGLLPDGRPYLVMPMIVGNDLSVLLQREGPQPPQRVATLLKGVASALDSIHERGLLHRDIKSENLMHVRRADGAESVLVLDFGIASARLPRSEQQQGPWCGTPEFMPPEALVGEDTDHRGDVYALATVAFELITGCLPFDSNDVTELIRKKIEELPRTLSEATNVAFPSALEEAIARGLSSLPETRFGTASELVDALTAAAAEMTDGVVVPKPPVHSTRGRTLVGTGAALGIAGANTPTPTGVRQRHKTRRDFRVAQAESAKLEPTAEPAATTASITAPAASITAPTASITAPAASTTAPAASTTEPPRDQVHSIGPAALARKLAQSRSARPGPLPNAAPANATEQPSEAGPTPVERAAPVEPLLQGEAPPPPADVTWPHSALIAGLEDSTADPTFRPPAPWRRLRYLGLAALALLAVAWWAHTRPADRTEQAGVSAEPAPVVSSAAPTVAPLHDEPTAAEPIVREPIANAAPSTPAPSLPTAQAIAAPAALETKTALRPPRAPARTRGVDPGVQPKNRAQPSWGRSAIAPPVLSVRPSATEARARPMLTSPSSDSRPAKSRAARVEALTRAATDAMLGGALESAASLFDQAVKTDSGYAPAWRGKGLLLERTGRRREAAAAFRAFLRLQPTGAASAAIGRRLSALESKP